MIYSKNVTIIFELLRMLTYYCLFHYFFKRERERERWGSRIIPQLRHEFDVIFKNFFFQNLSESQLKFLSFWFQRIKKLIESDRGYNFTCCSLWTWCSDKSRRQQPITVITRPSLWAICKSMKCQTLFTEIIAEYWITNTCIYVYMYTCICARETIAKS